MRRCIVGVLGSGVERHDELAAPLGRWIAEGGYHLLTGGGGGVMEAVSEAFATTPGRHGLVIGVLKGQPQSDGRVEVAPPNPWVEIAIRTHLPLSGRDGTDLRSRNHINVLSADVLIGLPGGDGTRSELELAMRYGTPVTAFARHACVPRDWPLIRVATTLQEVAAFALPVLARAATATSPVR